MYRLDRTDYVQTPYIGLWSLLGFQAGFVNGFGFLACGRYVSHVTGFGTQIGIALAQHRPMFALELLILPASFIFGAFVSGVVTAARIERGKRPRFEQISVLLPLILLLVLVLGEYELFGPFGEELILSRDFALLFFLSFFCGMQNGCFAVLTKGQIRTTHLTGISTDIGSDLARIWFGRLKPEELRITKRINFSRISTFVSFGVGSIVSVRICAGLNYAGLAVPLVTSAVIAASIYFIGRHLDQVFGQRGVA